MAKCPKCGGLLDLEEDEVEEGEVISCPDCGADLEVVNRHPLELDAGLDEEEEEEGKKNREEWSDDDREEV